MISLLLFTRSTVADRDKYGRSGEISGRPRGTPRPSAGRYLAAYGELSMAAVKRFPW